eukprot:1711267-Prymnesium_polylepis.1
MPAATRRSISCSARRSSCARSKSACARTASASASSVPSCGPALQVCCGGHASFGSPLAVPAVKRERMRSSSMISSSSSCRCATVPTRSSAFDDQRVPYCVHPSPRTRISIWLRSAFSTSAFECARLPPSCAHAAYSSFAYAYCSTARLSSACTRSSRLASFSSSCSLSASCPSARAPIAALREYSTSDARSSSVRPK